MRYSVSQSTLFNVTSFYVSQGLGTSMTAAVIFGTKACHVSLKAQAYTL